MTEVTGELYREASAPWANDPYEVLDEPPASGSADRVLGTAATTLTDLWFNAVHGDAARSSSR